MLRKYNHSSGLIVECNTYRIFLAFGYKNLLYIAKVIITGMSANKLKLGWTIIQYYKTIELSLFKSHGHFRTPLNQIVPEDMPKYYETVFQSSKLVAVEKE